MTFARVVEDKKFIKFCFSLNSPDPVTLETDNNPHPETLLYFFVKNLMSLVKNHHCLLSIFMSTDSSLSTAVENCSEYRNNLCK